MIIQKTDFLVIGGGISGLGAAYELQKQGKEVLVLEKENTSGGRMITKVIDGIPCDLGAQFIASFYRNIPKLAQEFKLKSFNLHIPKLSIKKRENYYSIKNPAAS